MAFEIPSLDKLIQHAHQLEQFYLSERKELDQQRFLASYRKETFNEQRLENIRFIKNLASHIHLNRRFPNETLQYVLAGAYLFVLNAINQEYHLESSLKGRSACAKIILKLFNMNKVKEIPAEQFNHCLTYTKAYIRDCKKNSFRDTLWHATMTSDDLINALRMSMRKGVDSVSPVALCENRVNLQLTH